MVYISLGCRFGGFDAWSADVGGSWGEFASMGKARLFTLNPKRTSAIGRTPVPRDWHPGGVQAPGPPKQCLSGQAPGLIDINRDYAAACIHRLRLISTPSPTSTFLYSGPGILVGTRHQGKRASNMMSICLKCELQARIGPGERRASSLLGKTLALASNSKRCVGLCGYPALEDKMFPSWPILDRSQDSCGKSR